MTKQSEQDKWRKFLQPLITGLVAMMSAFTLYAQSASSNANDSRVTAVEVRVDKLFEDYKRIEELRRDVNELSKNVYSLIGEIRAYRNGGKIK